MLQISEKCRKEWKNLEGVRLAPYLCPAGKWTVGVGRRLYPNDKIPGLTYDAQAKKWTGSITKEECEKLFEEDVAKYSGYIRELVKVPLTQYQFDALVLFVENVGKENLRTSTLLRLLNKQAEKYLVQAEFTRWVKDDDGNVIPGLVCRRQFEGVMFAGKLG